MKRKQFFTYEPDDEVMIIANSEESARRFFGLPSSVPVRNTGETRICPNGEYPLFAIDVRYFQNQLR